MSPDVKTQAGEEQRWATAHLAWGTECSPARLEMRRAAGRGQTRKGPVRKVREADLDAEDNKGLKRGSLRMRKVTGWARDGLEKAGLEAAR